MKAVAALTVLFAMLIGSVMLAKTPDARPKARPVAITEYQGDNAPPYLHFDPSDWR